MTKINVPKKVRELLDVKIEEDEDSGEEEKVIEDKKEEEKAENTEREITGIAPLEPYQVLA